MRRTLRPNAIFDCEICGAHVEKYVAPSEVAKGKARLRFCSRVCKGIAQRGPAHHAWKGGRRLTADGYVLVYAPGHPFATAAGYVREHRLFMERVVGRLLRPEEVVHHRNGDTADNRLENLQLFADQAAHKAHEHAQRLRDGAGRYLPLEVAA